jgi:hypothetical protein
MVMSEHDRKHRSSSGGSAGADHAAPTHHARIGAGNLALAGHGEAAHGRAPVGEGGLAPGSNAMFAGDYARWKTAIDGGDRAQATAQWHELSDHARAQVGHESRGFLGEVIDVMQKDSPQVLAAAHAEVADHAAHILRSPEFAAFLPTMRHAHLVRPFLHASPHRGHVTEHQADVLGTWIEDASGVDEARAIFDKVYPPVHDHANPALAYTEAKPQAWSLGQIRRLYDILTHHLPVGHAQTLSGGFHIQKQLDFGWYEFKLFRIVLPGHSGSRSNAADIKHHGNHDMTSGGRSGTPGTYTIGGDKPGTPGTPGTQTHLGHYTITALHEVGHGVGDRMGGHAYAADPGHYPGWTPVDEDDWGEGLWSHPTGKGDDSVPAAARLIPNQARAMMLLDIKYGAGSYQLPGASYGDIVKWVKSRYSNVPLFKWWQHLVEHGKSKGDAYRFADHDARVRGPWTYAYLTRAGDKGPYMKLKTPAYENRVSWYSMSSPFEWFAEQYAHYYRTEKTGGGLIDPATRKFLDKLDDRSFHGGAGKPGHGAYGGESAGGEATSGEGAGGGGESAGEAPRGSSGGAAASSAAAQVEPLFFPW